jgi:soluble epoxide hydrolase/lipid-phosphate phosphatase
MTKFEEHEFTHGEGGEKKTFFLAAGPKDGPLIIFIHGK